MTRYYTVTDENGAYARTYPDHWASQTAPSNSWALDVGDAAHLWAEWMHSDLDYPDEMVALVTDPDGKRWRVVVTTERTITFSAAIPEEVTE